MIELGEDVKIKAEQVKVNNDTLNNVLEKILTIKKLNEESLESNLLLEDKSMTLDALGNVSISFLAKKTSGAYPSGYNKLLKLPASIRPKVRKYGFAITNNGWFAFVRIDTNGDLLAYTPNNNETQFLVNVTYNIN